MTKKIKPVRERGKNAKTEGDREEEDATETFQAYFEYNRVLRTWFVAFGVGGPVLFLVNENVARRLVDARVFRFVLVLFLVGVAAQVFGALLNKVANWYEYTATIDEGVRRSCRHRAATWLLDQFWIDILVDVITIGTFGWAAWTLLTVFAAARGG